eukprot:5160228-Pleurochrysis_carterae.AAC.2
MFVFSQPSDALPTTTFGMNVVYPVKPYWMLRVHRRAEATVVARETGQAIFKYLESDSARAATT